MKLSVIIPVYNEFLTLMEIIQRVRAVDIPKEIILVDDASTDGTRNLFPELASLVDRIVLHEKNQGKGAAIRTGLQHITGDYVVIQDAHLEYDPQEYHKLLEPLLQGKADVVYGSRFLSGEARRVLYFWHSVGNRFLTLVSNMLTNLNLTDMETCYKMFRSDILKGIKIEQDRFGFEPEITGKLAKRNVRFYEVGITYHGRSYEEGKKIGWKDGLHALYCVLKYSRGRYREIGKATLHILAEFEQYNRWLLKQFHSYLGKRILEIGSGIGNISKHLTNHDILILSDINKHYLEILKKRFGNHHNIAVQYYDMTKNGSVFAGREVDTVICLNSLEHIERDQEVIENFSRILIPSGRLILLVPAHPFLFNPIDRYLAHYRRYSLKELCAKLQQKGFRIEHVQYLNRLGAIGWFISGNIFRAKAISYRHISIHKFLMPFMKLLDRMRFLPFGLSLLVVAQKTGQAPDES
jgi:glycosyltransferase involved in cell wall biosynthesis